MTMTEEELEQRHKELQEKFASEQEYQSYCSSLEIRYRNAAKAEIKKPINQIQREFDLDILSDEEYEKVNTDLANIKRVLISQNRDIEYLMSEQNRLMQLLYTKEREVIHLESRRRSTENEIVRMKRVILQQQERINEYEDELINLQNDQKTNSNIY